MATSLHVVPSSVQCVDAIRRSRGPCHRFLQPRSARDTATCRLRSATAGLVLLLLAFPGAAAAQWVQLGQDIDGEASGDYSGTAVAMSGDGQRVAVGAPYNDDNGDRSGHARVYSCAIFSGDFESGNTSAWSSSLP